MNFFILLRIKILTKIFFFFFLIFTQLSELVYAPVSILASTFLNPSIGKFIFSILPIINLSSNYDFNFLSKILAMLDPIV